MPDLGGHKVHLTDEAAVMLEGCNFLRVWRPEDHWLVASDPSRIVGCVAVMFNTISRELCLSARGQVTHPEIMLSDKYSFLSIGGNNSIP